MFSDKVSKIKGKTKAALRSQRGKNILLYLMFVCVAFVFWVLLSLDSEIQKDVEVNVEISDIPNDVTLLGRVPDKFYVTVKGKGSQLLRFIWGKNHNIKIRFDGSDQEYGYYSYSSQKIEGRLRDYFGQGVQIITVKPDSISVPFTRLPGETLPLIIDADVQPDLQCVISGPITANVDSVKIFGLKGVPRSIEIAETDLVSLDGLKDTTKITVDVKSIPGYRIIPDKVTVTIPVEPLISKKKMVQVETIGVPEGIGLLTFPSSVEVSYLVPISRFNDDYPIKVFADYANVDSLDASVAVTLSSVPDYFKNVVLTPDKVEYIIERRHIDK